MKPPARISIFLVPRLRVQVPTHAVGSCRADLRTGVSRRAVHSSTCQPARVAPLFGTGPPPEPPVPSPESADERIARRRKQAELWQAQNLRAAAAAGRGSSNNTAKAKKESALRKRFWKDVSVREVDGAYEIYLDTRPLRHPTTKAKVRLPLSKPHLAHALALEWDLLMSAQQATKDHLVPLTGLVCRALDIFDDDAAHAQAQAQSQTTGPGKPASSSSSSSTKLATFAPVRTSIATTLLRYLDTDSLLCWSPPPDPLRAQSHNAAGATLRELQERTACDIVAFLSARVWPGVEIGPVLDEHSIVPRGQKPGVREVVQGWVMGLEPWDLAGLERAALAAKGLLGAARLVVEWSEGAAGVRADDEGMIEGPAEGGEKVEKRFGVEEAAKAASLEVDWQTGRWGEVEDTHDVEKEDLRRQLGSVVLLVSGTGRR